MHPQTALARRGHVPISGQMQGRIEPYAQEAERNVSQPTGNRQRKEVDEMQTPENIRLTIKFLGCFALLCVLLNAMFGLMHLGVPNDISLALGATIVHLGHVIKDEANRQKEVRATRRRKTFRLSTHDSHRDAFARINRKH